MTSPVKEPASGTSYAEDLAFIVRITCVAWLVTLLLSWPAYMPGLRIFQISPVIAIFGAAPAWLDWALFGLQIGCLAGLILRPRQRLLALGALGCAAFWVLQDLMRFQPYIYMYFFTILAAVLFGPRGRDALKIMTGSVYFWGGFHKLNLTFLFAVFPWFISPFYKFASEPNLIGIIILIAISFVPFFEAAIGVLLLFFPAQRRLATLMALIMLVAIFICLGPIGRHWNIIIWPWNLYLFLIEFILFYKPAPVPEARWQFNAPALAAIGLFSIAPALALAGWWHAYPAFKLYSGNVKNAEVVLAQDENIAHLPKNLGHLVGPANRLPVFNWTLREFEMAAYPETYVFRQGAEGLCPYLTDPQNATIRIYDAPAFYSTSTTYQEFPLCPEEAKLCLIPQK